MKKNNQDNKAIDSLNPLQIIFLRANVLIRTPRLLGACQCSPYTITFITMLLLPRAITYFYNCYYSVYNSFTQHYHYRTTTQSVNRIGLSLPFDSPLFLRRQGLKSPDYKRNRVQVYGLKQGSSLRTYKRQRGKEAQRHRGKGNKSSQNKGFKGSKE